MANTDAQAQARDAQFDETPFGTGMCPLLIDVALFPVRYAIDEAPAEAGASAPHPIAGQAPDYPDIETRRYTLRQLRDGWIYVWVEEEGEQRLDEYRVEGATFSGAPHLTYSTRASIALAYSSVQWTDRIREHMLENADARQRLMRPVNLMAALNATADGTSFSAHVGPLTQLAEHVADITPNGAVDGFTATTVSTVEREAEPVSSEEEGGGESAYELLAVKPEITQDSVLAGVEHHDEALFVALDDNLGIVNDLAMALVGREIELEAFLDEHGHKLETAQVVKSLCLIDIDNLISDEVRQDPERYREITVKTGELLDAMKRAENGSDHTLIARQRRVTQIREELIELGMPHPPNRNSEQYEEWHGKELPRLDVRLDEAIAFLTEKVPQLERLQTHIENSLADLIIWLERLPLSAQELCFDTVDAKQNQAIHEFSCMVIEALGATQTGRAWLNDTYQASGSLIGFAMSNLDPALAEALETIAQHFLEQGTEDGEPADNGIGAASVAARISAFRGILKYEKVQSHPAYKALAPHVKEAFDTLRVGVNGPTQKAWESTAYHFLPSLSARGQVSVAKATKALLHPLMVVLVHPDVTSSQLVLDLEYEAKHREWREKSWKLTRDIRAAKRQRNVAEMKRLEQQRYEHAYDEPRRVSGADDTLDRSNSGNQARANNLASVGFYEQREIHRLKIMGGVRAARRHLTGFVERMGGGLPLLIAGLNLYNFQEAVRTANQEGIDGEEARNLATTASFAAGATMSLWVMPFWSKHAKQKVMLSTKMTEVAKAGITQWSGEGLNQTARLAAKLATRVAGLSAIGAISAGLDTWNSLSDYGEATSDSERTALLVKAGAGISMAFTASAQMIGALRAGSNAFAWILGGWVSGILFAAGVIHLIASHFAARYNREGIRGWLYTSTWGNGEYQWDATDEGENSEWQALMEILLQPSVRLTAVKGDVDLGASHSTSVGVKINYAHEGFWVQIAFPASLAGDTVRISEIVGGGFWAPGDSFEQSPSQQVERGAALPADAEYNPNDVRIWQAWIPASEQAKNATFILTVDYAETLLSSENHLSFTFYKPNAAAGKKVIEPNSDESQGLSAPARFALVVPITSEE
ncbi:T6SS effector BTH_I2691 family protein [Halomonas sp. AOP13-D3-9]